MQVLSSLVIWRLNFWLCVTREIVFSVAMSLDCPFLLKKVRLINVTFTLLFHDIFYFSLYLNCIL